MISFSLLIYFVLDLCSVSELMLTFEFQALGHLMGRNMSFCTYGGPPVVSSGPSQPIPGENDIIEVQYIHIFPVFSLTCLMFI